MNGCASFGVEEQLQMKGKVVAVWRGDCAFDQKARNIQQTGAVMMVVLARFNDDPLVEMQPFTSFNSSPLTSILIPCTMLNYADSMALINAVDKFITVTVLAKCQLMMYGMHLSDMPVDNVFVIDATEFDRVLEGVRDVSVMLPLHRPPSLDGSFMRLQCLSMCGVRDDICCR